MNFIIKGRIKYEMRRNTSFMWAKRAALDGHREKLLERYMRCGPQIGKINVLIKE